MLTIGNLEYKKLQKILLLNNGIIPDEIWLRPKDDASWEKLSSDYTRQMESDKNPLSHPQQ